MHKRFIYILSLFILSLMFAGFNFSIVQSADHSVHNLNTGLSYAAIQEAIDAPDTLDGHTILVDEGYYYENVEFSKSNLTLRGENKFTTVIDGNGTDIVVSLKANRTKITGFTLKNGNSFGLQMNPWTTGHVISNNIIKNNHYGLSGHYDCTNISIIGNTIAFNNITGLLMDFSFSIVKGNLIFDNGMNEFQEYGSGVQVAVGYLPGNGEYSFCVNNTIVGNTIKDHQVGVWMTDYSENNLFIHNNFVNNENQFQISAAPWNNTLLENFWSDYNGGDANLDGVGDVPYQIYGAVLDENPLMGMFSSYGTSIGSNVEIISNSTLLDFQYFESNRTIKLHVSNSSKSQISGFCRFTISYILMSEPLTVTIDGANPFYQNYNLFDNGSHRWIYFVYLHSTLEIIIIPEFTLHVFLFLTFVVTMCKILQKHAF